MFVWSFLLCLLPLNPYIEHLNNSKTLGKLSASIMLHISILFFTHSFDSTDLRPVPFFHFNFALLSTVLTNGFSTTTKSIKISMSIQFLKEREEEAADKAGDTLLLVGGVKSQQVTVKFCIHLHKDVERVCNSKRSHIVNLAIIVMKDMLAWRRIKFLKWSGRIKVVRRAWLIEEDIKKGLCVKAALLSSYFKRWSLWHCG